MKTACVQNLHESELSFVYYMVLYPRKLQIYGISKLLRVFSEYPVICASCKLLWISKFVQFLGVFDVIRCSLDYVRLFRLSVNSKWVIWLSGLVTAPHSITSVKFIKNIIEYSDCHFEQRL